MDGRQAGIDLPGNVLRVQSDGRFDPRLTPGSLNRKLGRSFSCWGCARARVPTEQHRANSLSHYRRYVVTDETDDWRDRVRRGLSVDFNALEYDTDQAMADYLAKLARNAQPAPPASEQPRPAT